MIDSGKADDKIIAVASGDPQFSHIEEITQLPEHFLLMLKNYFEQYKVLENKKVEINEFQTKEKAWQVVNDAIDLYLQQFKNHDTSK